MGIAALTFSSCAKDLTKEVSNGQAIDFRTPAVTKGYVYDEGNLNEFYTFAFMKDDADKYYSYFENVKFSHGGLSYTSTPAYYWPDNDENLYFYAYAPAINGLAPVFDAANQTLTLTGLTPPQNIDGHIDFITAYTVSNATDGANNVEINFYHRTSEITIWGKNTNPAYVYKVKGVRIGGLMSTGTYTFQAGDYERSEQGSWPSEEGTWSASGEKVTYEDRYDTPKELGSEALVLMGDRDRNADNGYYTYDTAMVIPQDATPWDPSAAPYDKGAYIGLLINITTTDGGQVYPATKEGYDWIAYPIDTELLTSYKYKYTLDFSNGAGYVAPELDDAVNNVPGTKIGNQVKLTVEVNDWEEEEVINSPHPWMVGTWQATRFVSMNRNSEGEWVVSGTYEGADVYHAIGDFYRFRINKECTKMTTLNDDDTEKGSEFEFSYDAVENKLYIDSMVGMYQQVEERDDAAGTVTLLLDYYTITGSGEKQYITFQINK